MFWKVRSPERPVPQVGWTCARQRAAVLRPTKVGPHAAAARIQCRICASADVFGGFWDDWSSASECFWEFRTWWEGVEKLLTCCWDISCWPSRHDITGAWDAPWCPSHRSGVCQLFVVEFWASSPHRSNRTERDYNRTIVISAAWIEIVLRTFFCMACRLGCLCWSCVREIWAVNILTHFKSPEHRLWARCGFQSAFQIKMDKDG